MTTLEKTCPEKYRAIRDRYCIYKLGPCIFNEGDQVSFCTYYHRLKAKEVKTNDEESRRTRN